MELIFWSQNITWIDIQFLKHSKERSFYCNTDAKRKHIWKSPLGDKADEGGVRIKTNSAEI